MDIASLREFNRIEIIDPYTNQPRDCFLVKYEKERYPTVRIGTLSYFRDLEGNQSDPLDGRVEGLVFAPGKYQPVSREDILAISNGALDIQARDGIAFGETGSYRDKRFHRCHNTYIYCCSMEFGVFPNEDRKSHFGASEYFVIDETDQFIQNVAKELALRGRTIEGKAFDPDIHYIKWYGAPVRYRERKMANVELPMNVLDFFIYQKDPKFTLEQEYRFTWMVFEKGTDKPVEVAPDPIEIPKEEHWGTAHIESPLSE